MSLIVNFILSYICLAGVTIKVRFRIFEKLGYEVKMLYSRNNDFTQILLQHFVSLSNFKTPENQVFQKFLGLFSPPIIAVLIFALRYALTFVLALAHQDSNSHFSSYVYILYHDVML